MSRLTTKIEDLDFYKMSSAYIDEIPNQFLDKDYVGTAINKLGKLEDIMEKYEIENLEELEELIKDYDDMAKSVVEMGLGIKVEIKNRSE